MNAKDERMLLCPHCGNPSLQALFTVDVKAPVTVFSYGSRGYSVEPDDALQAIIDSEGLDQATHTSDDVSCPECNWRGVVSDLVAESEECATRVLVAIDRSASMIYPEMDHGIRAAFAGLAASPDFPAHDLVTFSTNDITPVHTVEEALAVPAEGGTALDYVPRGHTKSLVELIGEYDQAFIIGDGGFEGRWWKTLSNVHFVIVPEVSSFWWQDYRDRAREQAPQIHATFVDVTAEGGYLVKCSGCEAVNRTVPNEHLSSYMLGSCWRCRAQLMSAINYP